MGSPNLFVCFQIYKWDYPFALFSVSLCLSANLRDNLSLHSLILSVIPRIALCKRQASYPILLGSRRRGRPRKKIPQILLQILQRFLWITKGSKSLRSGSFPFCCCSSFLFYFLFHFLSSQCWRYMHWKGSIFFFIFSKFVCFFFVLSIFALPVATLWSVNLETHFPIRKSFLGFLVKTQIAMQLVF